MKKTLRLLLVLSIFLPCFSVKARAELSIDVTGAVSEPLPIALAPFATNNYKASGLAGKITQVIAADLESSGLFQPLDADAFGQTFKSVNDAPQFNLWKAVNAQALLQGEIKYEDKKAILVSFRLWDVYSAQDMISGTLEIDNKGWRRVAHLIADAVYKRITGEDGYFDTRIVYIAESGPALKRVKRLAIMDQDGENHQFLTSGKNLVLTPRFSPNMQQITYMSYYKNTPRVYLFDIETGKQQIVGHFPGMTFAPRFSPDGQKLVMSMAKNGNTEIFEMNLRTKAVRQLTRHPAIDTSPSYSPDGKRIVFNSDRAGTQQLYIMNADGSNVRRITFSAGRYATPVWSPRGDYIAFTKMLGGKFYIGVMFPDGTGERLLANGWLVEAPTWSPNGRILMYFRQEKPDAKGNSSTQIYAVDITGYNERRLITPVDASDPAWSPLLSNR